MDFSPIASSLHRTDSNDSSVPPTRVAPGTDQSLMPDVQLVGSGDPGAMLAALVVESGKTQGDVARQTRHAAEHAQVAAESAEIQDMHDKADLQREQGIIDGALQIAQGVGEFAKGMNEASATVDGGAAKQADEERATCWGAGAAGLKGAQSVVDGVFNGNITDKDADEKVHEASADACKQIAADAHDDEKDAKDLMNKALDFYKEYVDAKNQTTMAAIHRA